MDRFGIEGLQIGDGKDTVDALFGFFLGLVAGGQGALFGVSLFTGFLNALALAFDHFGGTANFLLGDG